MVISSARVMWLITMATRRAIVKWVSSQGHFAAVPVAVAGAPAAGGVWAPAGAAARASAAPVARASNDAPNVRDKERGRARSARAGESVTGTAFQPVLRTSVAAPRAVHHSRGIHRNPADLLSVGIARPLPWAADRSPRRDRRLAGPGLTRQHRQRVVA